MPNFETILNLGCGSRTSEACINIDFSIQTRLSQSRFGSIFANAILRGERLERFRSLQGRIVVHDLTKGIPAESDTVDAVYHSHTLEHLDRHVVPGFFSEIRRVLRPGGIHRIVVPDFEVATRSYLRHVEECDAGHGDLLEHDQYIARIIEQMVRREAAGTSQQPKLRRLAENLLLGDARKRGETHQWMYDRHNLRATLEQSHFRQIALCDFETSSIPRWNEVGLDADSRGGEYKKGSLYMEAVK